MKKNLTDTNGRIDRRSMLKSSTTLIGAGLLGSLAVPQMEPAGLNCNNIFNVRDYGATGNRADSKKVILRNNNTAKASGAVSIYPSGR